MKTLTIDDEMPATARSLWRGALEHGWSVWATSATGTPVDASGEPVHRTERRPLVDTNTGAPLMTDLGKPRVEVVKLDELQVVDSVVVRLRRGDVRIAATWEDGSFRTGLQQRPFRRLNSREIAAVVAS